MLVRGRDCERPLTLFDKLVVILAVGIALGSNSWPEEPILRLGLHALGSPPYEGLVGAFLPHLLLYTTVMALVCAALWWGLVRAQLLPKAQLGNVRESIVPGVLGGIAGIVLTLIVVWATLPTGTVHWITPAPWKIAGNVFSNFYEEFVFRGFILTALRRLAGFWPAAILSSAIWGFLHTQYPIPLRLLIVVVGIGLCWLVRRAKSLWAPYFAHEVLDLIGDSLIG